MKKGSKDVYAPYVKLENDMTNSAAWRILSDPAVFTYIELRKSFNATKGGNDHLVLSYRQIMWRYTKVTIQKAFGELIEMGFIKIMHPGGVERGKGTPRIFALSDGWKRKSQELVKKFGGDARDFKEAILKGYYKKQRSREYGGGLKKHNEDKKKEAKERKAKSKVNSSEGLTINEKRK